MIYFIIALIAITVCVGIALLLITIFSKKKKTNTQRDFDREASEKMSQDVLNDKIERNTQKESQLYKNSPKTYLVDTKKK